MFCKVEEGRVLRGPSADIVGDGVWLPYEEKLVGDIDHATQDWGAPSFGVLSDKVIGRRTATTKPPLPPEIARAAAKAARSEAVAAIVVSVGGKDFNGDEISQGRMARAIIAMQAAGVSSTRWVLASNEEADVSLPEMTEALILAGKRQSELWVLP